MANKPTQKERRMESDRRIISSAIRLFGKLGYTYSSIRDIAAGAGITSGLITQRYGTKEALFEAAYLQVMQSAFSDVEATATPRECLYHIIADVKKMIDEDPDAFAFCTMLHNATDYPKEVLIQHQEQQKRTNLYTILKKAQAQGMIPKGNFDVLLASFGATVFHNIGMCKHYGIEYPSSEKLLDFVRFCDAESARTEQWNRILETAITNTFDLLVYVDLVHNTGEILRHSGSEFTFEVISDIRQALEPTIRKIAPENEYERLSAYLDLDTLSERMKGRKSLSLKITDIDEKPLVHSFLPIAWDENGTLTEVLAGVYRVQPNGLSE